MTLNLLMEVVNGRLFGTVRDTLGLTYDVSFEMHMHDRLGPGLFVISTTSTPDKIQVGLSSALSASDQGLAWALPLNGWPPVCCTHRLQCAHAIRVQRRMACVCLGML